MLRKTDLFAIITIFAVVFCGCLWWQDLERRAAQAGEPVGDVPRLNLAPKEPLKEPARGFGKARLSADAYAKRYGYERAKGKMAALPGGYVRVRRGGSETQTISGGGTMKVWINTDVGISDAQYDAYKAGAITLGEFIASMSAPLVNSATVAGVTLRSYSCYGPNSVAGYGHVMLVVSESPGGQISEEQCDYILDPNPYEVHDYSRWSDPVTVSWSFGPCFLGEKFTCETPAAGGPAFSYRDGELRHSWFGDENTRITIEFAGRSYSFAPYTEITEIGSWIDGFAWGGSIHTEGVDAAIISNLHLSGADIDTTGLDSTLGPDELFGCMKGFGGGECRLNTNYSPTRRKSGMAWARPPVIINYDLNITKHGKHQWTGAKLHNWLLTDKHYNSQGVLLTPNYPDGLQIPFRERIVFQMTTWNHNTTKIDGISALCHSFSLLPTWMDAQDPKLPESDSIVPIQGPVPNIDALEREDYDAITLSIIPEIDVHRPDGNKLSEYSTSNIEKLEVSEGATDTTFIVKKPGGVANRVLAASWLDYLTKTSGRWTYDTCRITKHIEGEEDVWWWGSYAYMDVTFVSPVDCKLMLTATWVKPVITDTYTLPPSERFDNWEWHPQNGSSSWSIPLKAKPSEEQTVRIKLLFPLEGGPAYLGRITSLQLSGFVPMPDGEPARVVLKGMKLVSSKLENGDYYPYYVKIAPGPPVQRGKYSLVGIAHDGATVTMLIPDTEYKKHEILENGGNLRYCEPLTSSVEGVPPLDWQVDIGTIAAWLNSIEGLVASYNEGASDTALGDEYTKLGPENADWLVPVYPDSGGTGTPGKAFVVAARPMCRTLGITNAVEWEIKVDHALMFGIEVQAKTGNEPAPEGVVMRAYYLDDGGAKHVDPLARGVTDQNGYCVVAPIPADESREYDVEQAA